MLGLEFKTVQRFGILADDGVQLITADVASFITENSSKVAIT